MKQLLKPSLDWLLVFVFIMTIAGEYLFHFSETMLFLFSCVSIIPLAGWLGKATEHLAEKTGEGIGGLLNATFGNAAELIIAVMAIQAGLYDVVKASITGSIIGNILLGTRCCIVGRWTETQDAIIQRIRCALTFNDAHTGIDRTDRTGGLPLFRRTICFTGGGPECGDIDGAGRDLRTQPSLLPEDA